jgi:hypothetical protein
VTIDEITEINEYIQEVAKDTDIIFGTCDDPSMGSKISVTIIATGFEATYKPAFLTPVNKIVRDLNEDVKEKQATSLPLQEVKQSVVKETAQLNLLNLDDQAPVQKAPKVEPVVAATPPTERVTLNMDEEEAYSLFSMLDTAKEEITNENTVIFEFATTPEEYEEEVAEEISSVVEMPLIPETI